MRNSSKDLSVFDFASEQTDEAAERFTNYQFLKAFQTGNHHFKQADVCSLSPTDSLEVSSPQSSTPERNVISTVDKFEFNEVLARTSTHVNHAKRCPTSGRLGGTFEDVGLSTLPSGGLLSSVCDEDDSETQSSETPVYLMSDVDESCTSLSVASSISGDLLEAKGPLECSALEHCHSAYGEMDDDGKPVVFCPDFVTHGDAVFLESQISFCSDCISIECSEANGTGEKLILEYDIADVIRISCQWSRSVDVLLIKFWIRTDLGCKVDKFLASVTDMCWSEKGQVIKFLAKRYTDIWDTLPDNDYAFVDDIFRNRMSFSKQYFTEIAEPFEDVIYPKGDADAVCISKRDIELLEPNTFINDTIIDFYIKYLQDKITPIERKRFYFFNSFSFEKLADLDKNPASISEGRAAFQRVRKWTRKVNIFEKDYLFIPVNFNLHWSLLVICHPGEITTFNGDAIKRSPRVPCILHMDSIKGSHSGLKNLIQSYLFEEWKGRNSELSDDISSQFSNLKFVCLELPQQENSSDCGLFVLHYVELFLKEAPICFNPNMITKLSSFLNADWFPPAEASFKRFYIRGLLYELLRDSTQERNPIGSCVDFPNSGDDVEQLQFLSTQDGPSKIINEQRDSFEETASIETGHPNCPIEVNGDGKAVLTELLESDAKEDCPSSLFCSTVDIVGSCEMPCISMEAKQESSNSLPTSTINLETQNERDETQKIAPLMLDACAIVPDTPDTICDEQLKQSARNSHESSGSELEVEMLSKDDPTDDQAKGAILLGTREEETCLEGNNTSETVCIPATPSKLDDLDIVENADGDDCQEIVYVAKKGGINSDNVVAISVEMVGTQTKWHETSVAEQRVSKRCKVVGNYAGRRITRSSSRKLPP
ncbi:hypothetical protein HPP92_027908 [Vanilla planifolia]|uniref:Ubiquitin-like protease family profile domain-containing protein n=1 Tax=Vanilla planifolia TaxID=51239 RepID=A0A835U6U6_VANPL|nr:hypothetical protein HPP92_027908 [Vanilla planifolia]KAG0448417.1 hypothetical protein HPP92_027860 [Vanilla planifolia]